jgi:hypothetical protein
MAYGSDITEAIPYNLSNPPVNSSYNGSTVAYDIAIGGQPFFLETSDDSPYRRVTAQYRKQQLDTTREPGEQTLTGWWIRSQSTFHLGQGINFFEPAQDESLRFQYKYSKGCDVWTKGQATLLRDVTSTNSTTGTLNTNLRPYQYARSIRWSSINGVLLHDNYTIKKISVGGTSTDFQINVSGTDAPIFSVCDDGVYAYWITNSSPTGDMRLYKKLLTDNYTTSPTLMFTGTGLTVTNAVIEFTKQRIVAGINNKVYEIITTPAITTASVTAATGSGTTITYTATNTFTVGQLVTITGLGIGSGSSLNLSNVQIATATSSQFTVTNTTVGVSTGTGTATGTALLPSAVYTHPDQDIIWTSISSSGSAIYLSAYSGIQSNIFRFTLDTTGAMPTLTSAITAAELPVGEKVFKIAYYLGYLAIGSSQGLRIANVSETNGSLAYGPLIFESEQAVYDVAFRDRYLWCTTNVDGAPGITRVDLGQQVGTNLVFAYAWDLYKPGVTGHLTTACAFNGNTDQLTFVTNYASSTSGAVYIEEESILVESGFLRTGFIRYNTLENKIFKTLTPRFDTTNGGIVIYTIQANGLETDIGTYPQGSTLTQIGIPYPATPQQYLGFEFQFTRDTTDSTLGPKFTGYQVNVLPSIPRQRLIQYPAMCYDFEMDKFNNQAGYDGAAYTRQQVLERIEDVGDTVLVQDFRTGESYLGLIEEQDFINKTPTDKRYSGYGGVLLITIRKV